MPRRSLPEPALPPLSRIAISAIVMQYCTERIGAGIKDAGCQMEGRTGLEADATPAWARRSFTGAERWHDESSDRSSRQLGCVGTRSPGGLSTRGRTVDHSLTTARGVHGSRRGGQPPVRRGASPHRGVQARSGGGGRATRNGSRHSGRPSLPVDSNGPSQAGRARRHSVHRCGQDRSRPGGGRPPKATGSHDRRSAPGRATPSVGPLRGAYCSRTARTARERRFAGVAGGALR